MRHLIPLIVAGLLAPALAAADTPVRLEKQAQGWTLLRDGKPFLVKGAGGSGPYALLASLGANTQRTWGVGPETKPLLDEAQKHGLAVVVGIWLGHERHGFDWNDAAVVRRQHEQALAAVKEYKDHPAVLAWGLGNEMEGFAAGDNEAIWRAIGALAKDVKALDPGHPTLTTVAEIGGRRVELIHRHCPDIDIVGINSYGGAPSLPQRYRAAGGTKPYMITEYGPLGTWEIGRNAFGAVDEPTSGEKATFYRDAYAKLAADRELCLGSIAFTWGNKVEATSTWYGMLLPDGSRLAACDALAEAWGRPVKNRCPVVAPLTVAGERVVKPGVTVKVALKATDPENDALAVQWVVCRESLTYDLGGDTQAAPETHPEAIVRSDQAGCELRFPDNGGVYRVFAYVRDGKGGAAMANTTFKVDAPERLPTAAKLALPGVVYAGGQNPHWYPTGWMGDAGALTMDPGSKEQPRTPGGVSCRFAFAKQGGWVGVVWQNPGNDWGDKAGGFDLTGATKLTFWARGEKGGESVTFGTGIIDARKTFHDTVIAETKLTLTAEWKPYSIDIAGKDLTRIKSGFRWVVHGGPATFWIDDVRYE